MLLPRRRALLGGAGWVLGLSGLFGAVSAGAQGASPRLRVATHSLPPYVIAQRAAPPQGALREFMDAELAPLLGVQFDWLPVMTALRVQRSLLDGSAELAPLLTLSVAGLRELQFAAEASLFMDSFVALRPGHPLLRRERVQAADLQGQHVGTALGLLLPPDLEGLDIRWDVVSATEADRAILTRVARGQLDAGYFSNPESPRWSAQQLGIPLQLRPLDVARRALFPAFARHVDPELVARYGPLAAQHFATERWTRTLQRWLQGVSAASTPARSA
ncbi:hypothetical protein [Inhella sp.]|uniref:hypothetical protein n=1 Tax=Inhella sp. TaxID=1921806 RepID=UPI0035B28CA5